MKQFEPGPINQFFNNFLPQNTYPFHMPGHKRNPAFVPNLSRLLDMDITEIAGADNLLAPEGIMLETQREMAAFYGAAETFMTVNGASGGIVAAILAACGDGGGIVLARNAHVSAYNGVVLAGARPAYVYPKMTEDGIPGGIDPADVSSLLEQAERARPGFIKAVFITSPTFEGFCSDVPAIAEAARRFGKLLIVDEAHGAHFGFHPRFPASAVTRGADIVIQSMHKTLPALNQSALVHACGNRADAALVKRCLSMVQTTSPSYPMLAVMESCFRLCQNKSLWDDYASLLAEARESMGGVPALRLIGREVAGKHAVADVDEGKLAFVVRAKGEDGKSVADKLQRAANLELEMRGVGHFVGMTSVADTREGFARIVSGIQNLQKTLDFDDAVKARSKSPPQTKPETALPPRQAAFMPHAPKPLVECAGDISAGFVIPYPPGVPLVVPGERFDEAVVSQITGFLETGIPVVGMSDGCVRVVI